MVLSKRTNNSCKKLEDSSEMKEEEEEKGIDLTSFDDDDDALIQEDYESVLAAAEEGAGGGTTTRRIKSIGHSSSLGSVSSCYLAGGGDNNSVNTSSSTTPPPMMKKSKVLFAIKWTVVGILMVAGTVVSTTSYLYSRTNEQTRFEEHFHHDAKRLISNFYLLHSNKMWAAMTLFSAYTALENYNNEGIQYPNVTLPEFDGQTNGGLESSKSDSIFFAPILLTPQTKKSWEEYAVQHQELAGINGTSSFHNRTIEEGVFRLLDDDESNNYKQELVDDSGEDGFTAPIWQINPPTEKRHLQMFNLNSVKRLQKTIFLAMFLRLPFFSNTLDEKTADFFLGTGERSLPRSLFLLPCLNKVGGTRVMGMLALEIDWIQYFDDVVGYGHDTDIVLRNTCGRQAHTFQVQRSGTIYRGEGDLHDAGYDRFKQGTTLGGFRDHWLKKHASRAGVTVLPDQGSAIDNLANATFLTEHEICVYSIDIYPTRRYDAQFTTAVPLGSVLVTVAVFVAAIFLFFIYDLLVERRQSQVLKSAANADAIVKSLFPAVVRDKLFRDAASRSNNNNNTTNKHHHHHHQRRLSLTIRRNSNQSEMTTDNNNNDRMMMMGFPILTTPKIRLTNFLSGTTAENTADREFDEPIAELFSNTTVMFADIAGFTAWSSVREPTQVFKLLETIYAAFDSIAKRLDVFKVETIGDCYVAVVGLPEPNKDHAVVCAQFADRCLLAMNQLTNQLELTLGPGTSELDMRIGLHSGPVTAGVLRGTKSRFQLFGDTMNTASRMESTSDEGKIQVSGETADLIHRAGRQNWLTPREGTVTAKGKGEMQTFWLRIGDCSAEDPQAAEGNQSSLQSSSADGAAEDMTSETMNSEEGSGLSFVGQEGPIGAPRFWGGNDDSVSLGLSTKKGDRLVDWNVEVLMGFLEKVVQHRMETKSQRNRSTRPSFKKSGLIIDEVVEIIELPEFAPVSRTKRTRRLAKLMPPIVRAQLREFVSCIASIYHDVPFHNFEHASHVTMSANKLMKRIITPDDDGNSKPLNAPALHSSTFGISSDPLTQFAVVFAALIHDVDHTGLTNSILVEKGFKVANIFSNKSVAEQNSVVVAWEMLVEPRFAELQMCIFPNDYERSRFRQLVVNAVMATDIMDPDMVGLRKKRWDKAFDLSAEPGDQEQDMHRKATIVIEHIIQASDVAHTMQHWHVFQRWNARLYKELYRSYKLGYTEKDPSDGWFEGQIGFFDHYVIPLAKKLKECGVFGVSGDEYLQYAEWNRQEWERKGREETRKMIAMRDEQDDKSIGQCSHTTPCA